MLLIKRVINKTGLVLQGKKNNISLRGDNMTTSFNLKRMIDTELHFASRFTNVTLKDWGLLFWNEGNKTSWDSNHAIIVDYVGVESTIREIMNFYKAKGITARIYPSLRDNELDQLKPHLEPHGFKIDVLPVHYAVHEKESKIDPTSGIHFERIRQMTEPLLELILAGGGGEWTLKVAQRHLQHPAYHLLGGYVQDELVCVASVNEFAGYSRVDDVMTHPFYRGKGYSSAMIHYMVGYHKRTTENYLYLYSSVPEAIHIYEKAGFVRIPEQFQIFNAYKE